MQKIKKAAAQATKKHILNLLNKKNDNLIYIDVSSDEYYKVEEDATSYNLDKLIFPITSGKIIFKNTQKFKNNIYYTVFLVIDFYVNKDFTCHIDFFKMSIPALNVISFSDFAENAKKYLYEKTTQEIDSGTIDSIVTLQNGYYNFKEPFFSNSYMQILEKRKFVDDEVINYLKKENLLNSISKNFQLAIDSFFIAQKIILHLLLNANNYDVQPKRATASRTLKDDSNVKKEASSNEILTSQKIIDLKNIQVSIKNKNDLHQIRQYRRKCKSWNVRGHFRHYKSGKVVFVQAHQKGSEKNTNTTIYKI